MVGIEEKLRQKDAEVAELKALEVQTRFDESHFLLRAITSGREGGRGGELRGRGRILNARQGMRLR